VKFPESTNKQNDPKRPRNLVLSLDSSAIYGDCMNKTKARINKVDEDHLEIYDIVNQETPAGGGV